ncbi:MAG: cytochrome c [Blastocatellales bacterium]
MKSYIRRRPLEIFGLITAILFVLTFVSSCSRNQSPVTSATTLPVNVTEDMGNPLSDLVRASNMGRSLYSAHCSLCHGADGKTAETALGTPPPDLTGEYMNSVKDGKLFLAIKNGVRRDGKQTMPPAKDVTDEQVWQMVAYVRFLAKDNR